MTCWNQTAEFVGEHLRKGQHVFVEGRLRRETYTDREGEPRTLLEVNASAVYALGKQADAAGETEPARPQTKAAAAGNEGSIGVFGSVASQARGGGFFISARNACINKNGHRQDARQ